MKNGYTRLVVKPERRRELGRPRRRSLSVYMGFNDGLF
jgi:hypothetical protein